LAKSCQKNTNKEPLAQSKTPSKRLFIDVSSIKDQSFGGSKFWLLVVDDATNLAFIFFLSQKINWQLQ